MHLAHLSTELCKIMILPAQQTQISFFLALLVFWKHTRGTHHKRVASPYQSACQPGNEQTNQGQCRNKEGGQTGRALCGQRVNAYISTWKQWVLNKKWAKNSAQTKTFIFRRHSADHKTALFKDMLGIRKFVLVLPPADMLPSFWMTSWGVSQAWSSISLFPYRISSSPPKKVHKTHERLKCYLKCVMHSWCGCVWWNCH